MSNMNIDNIKLYNKVFNDKNILIIGLGMIGGSFAKGLNEKGIIPYGYDINKATLDYAVKNNMINDSVDLYENIKIADIIILCLYPKNNIEWLKENQKYISPKTIITDVSGVKEYIIEEVKSFLRKDLTFISGHPMAGRESSGIFASDNSVFNNANYIIVPMNYDLTDKEEEGVYMIYELACVLGFSNIEVMTAKMHDELISYLSQLTHIIAVSLMNSHNVEEMIRYTGDSFRDLTRIAKINENMWSELFLLNKKQLVKDIENFATELLDFKDLLLNEKVDEMKEKMINSTKKRKLFDKKNR